MSGSIEKFPWATHQELLVACVCGSMGPVLELGCGHYSTPLLHHLCVSAGRHLVSCDTDTGWAKQFAYLCCPLHTFIGLSGWDAFDMWDSATWGTVLVDHSPGERRPADMERLRASIYLVAHDGEKKLGIREIASTFKYRVEDRRHSCTTIAVSDHAPIPWRQE